MSDRTQRLQDLADEELMTRYAMGEEAAFELLIARYRRPIFGFLYRYLRQADKAEDVFQEVFFEVIRSRKRYDPRHKFASWLFRIARNRAVDRVRRNGLRDMESLDNPLDIADPQGETMLTRVAASNPDPEAVVRGLELEKALDEAMASLPPPQREVVWLKERSGLTMAEVAKIIGISENTVKSRLRYALEKIRSHLTRQGYGP